MTETTAITDSATHGLKVPCCPELGEGCPCDILERQYRLVHTVPAGPAGRRANVQVEVIIHVRLERCPGPLALGDIAYSTTLLPGEKVRLFTTDRRTRFTFDSASKVSYRTEQTQEEHFYMSSMSDFMSDVNVRDSSRSTNTSRGSANGHAETSGALESLFGSPSVDVSGSYSAESTSDFLRELSTHVRASHHAAEMGTRAASSTSVGEVQSRSHAEGESEDHFESSSREFSNPNRCHAVTYFFYRINKTQTIKVTLVSIERRVIDPAAETKVTNNPFASAGDVAAIPNGVLATDENRLRVEEIARASVAARQASAAAISPNLVGSAATATLLRSVEPLTEVARRQALQQVDAQLVRAGLLDALGGQASPEAQNRFSFEICSSLPTPGLLVRGCLDECDVCEPSLQREIDLELEHKRLQNELLKRQIELLDKSQEYRCCPEDSAEAPA